MSITPFLKLLKNNQLLALTGTNALLKPFYQLNYLVAGKNFLWGAPAGSIPGFQTGLRIRVWNTEIVPTALAWHTGEDRRH